MYRNLPLVNPPITSSPSHANFLSIILNKEEGNEWFCSHYINFYLYEKVNQENISSEENKASFIDYGAVSANFSTLTNHYIVPRFIIKNNTLEFFIDSLNNDCYIIVKLNQFYLANSSSYQKEHIIHTTMISGYNIKTKKFLISDFYENGIYRRVEVDFNDVLKSFEPVEESLINKQPFHQIRKDDVLLIKLKNSQYKFSLKNTIGLLQEYIDGEDKTGRFNKGILYETEQKYNFTYGVKTMVKVAKLWSENKISFVSLHEIYDHKVAMSYRLKFISEKYKEYDFQFFINKYKEIENKALMLRNKAIKLSIKNTALDQIVFGYKEIEEMESAILPNLIYEMEKLQVHK